MIVLLPPLAAIVLALVTRRVALSLGAGVLLGFTILEGGDPLAGGARSLHAAVGVILAPGTGSVIAFTLLIGALTAIMEGNGGVRGFVSWVERRGWIRGPRGARVLAWALGVVIFIESNLTIVVSAAVCRPLFDRYRVSREKLAYLLDSASAPICILIPLNAWGAYVIGLLAGLGDERPLATFVAAVPLNLYAVLAVLLSGAVAVAGWSWGPMRRVDATASRTADDAADGSADDAVDHRADIGAAARPHGAQPYEAAPSLAPRGPDGARDGPWGLFAPVLAIIASAPAFMLLVGRGDLVAGAGTVSVMYAVMAGLATAWWQSLRSGELSAGMLTHLAGRGVATLAPMAGVLWLALTLAATTGLVGTGAYLAGILGPALPRWSLLPALFIVTAFVGFATGSSWGTFAIMLGVAVPLGRELGAAAPPILAAVLSGGIFGDHASPISDSTVVSSLAAGVDHIEHVRTQLPYALTAAAVAAAGFAGLGLVGR